MSVFACSDLHGRYDLFKMIQDFLKEDDKLFIIGDVFDRGPDGWRIYTAIKEDPRIVLLAGNHEILAADGLKEWYENGIGYTDWLLWVNGNGGQVTFDNIVCSVKHSEIPALITELNNLPFMHKYMNKDGIEITLVHSGAISSRKEDCIWDRRNLHRIHWSGADNELIVHGHTPIPLMLEDWKENNICWEEIGEYDGGALWWCENHKVCLDVGAVWTNMIVVLDLDTFDEHIFSIEKVEKGEING